MPRLVFAPGDLRQFIKSARTATTKNREKLAKELGISGRTLADWQREKFLPNQSILIKLSKLTNTPLPTPIEIRENWWSGRVNGSKGAKARFKKHGCSFTIEQRKKGGRNSQRNRKNNPSYYSQLGCPIPRSFTFPNMSNPHFAEFIGILLGDGCIQPNQVSITLNSVADKEYIHYVSRLIIRLFNYSPTILSRAPVKATTILISGKNFTTKLVNHGMKIGNKVKHQVDVPGWIKSNNNLSKWCLRGLIDTDGCIYPHKYYVNNKQYKYFKTNFTSLSQPLRKFAYTTLKKHKFNPKYSQNKHVYLYSQKETKKYLQIIGSSNPRLLNKIR